MINLLKELFKTRSGASYFVAPENPQPKSPRTHRVDRKQALAHVIDAAGSGWDPSFTAGLSALDIEELKEIFAESNYEDPTLTRQ